MQYIILGKRVERNKSENKAQAHTFNVINSIKQ